MNGTGNAAHIGAETVPSDAATLQRNNDLEIPTEPKAFKAWWTSHNGTGWPAGLHVLALRAFLALSSREQAAWSESYPLRKAAKADWSAFTTALAAYRAEAV